MSEELLREFIHRSKGSMVGALRLALSERDKARGVVEAARSFHEVYVSDDWGTDEALLHDQMVARNHLWDALATYDASLPTEESA